MVMVDESTRAGGRRTPQPAPCAAHPHSGLMHFDGTCRCFFGGPAPEFAPPTISADDLPTVRAFHPPVDLPEGPSIWS